MLCNFRVVHGVNDFFLDKIKNIYNIKTWYYFCND